MDEEIAQECEVMRKEFKWVLHETVHSSLSDIQSILTEACRNFALHLDPEQDNHVKPEKYLLSSPNGGQQVKCMVTLVGDLIVEADLGLKIQRTQAVPHQTRIYPENPWRLQQVQDAGNHLVQALTIVDEGKAKPAFTSGQEVISLVDIITDSLRLGRECLTLPRKRTLEEIVKNPMLKTFKPALPNDAAVSFYVQAHKLVLAVYHLFTNQLNKIDIASRHQLECSVPWLNDTLMLFTTALQLCQQLRDKVSLFMQYIDVFPAKLPSSATNQEGRNAAPTSSKLAPGSGIKLPHLDDEANSKQGQKYPTPSLTPFSARPVTTTSGEMVHL